MCQIANPHACAALDGKYVACRKSSGNIYYNYKHFYSIVLMGLLEADYKFLWIELGCHGHMSDEQIFN